MKHGVGDQEWKFLGRRMLKTKNTYIIYLGMNERKTLWKETGRKSWIEHIIIIEKQIVSADSNNEWIATIIVIMKRKMEGKAGRGRPRTPFMKQISNDAERIPYNKLRWWIGVQRECI